MQERCITPGVPRTFLRDMQILQVPGYVVLLNETRIIPLDGRSHLAQHIRLWTGDSRGHWEGNTLVVETTNFTDKQIFRLGGFPQGNLHLVERFTRIAPDQIDYQFTLTDASTWTRPWTVTLPLTKSEGPIYEYACHEGNYSLANILSGARAEEKWPTIEVHHGVDFVDAGARVPLKAEATAHGGAGVERVEFLVDGSVVGVDREAPYEVTWTTEDTGRHIVTATVHDNKGEVARSAPVTVFVGLRALERSIARSEDDAEERGDGSMGLTSSDLELTDDPDERVVALRFTEIRIPRGAQIEKAFVQFTAEEVDTEPTDLIIQAELAGNAMAPRGVPNELFSRKRTSASVNWSPEPWDVEGESSVRQRTPDLAALIQEVVDRPDWHEGNALVLLISGSGKRVALSYDGARWGLKGFLDHVMSRLERAPRLYIERR